MLSFDFNKFEFSKVKNNFLFSVFKYVIIIIYKNYF